MLLAFGYLLLLAPPEEDMLRKALDVALPHVLPHVLATSPVPETVNLKSMNFSAPFALKIGLPLSYPLPPKNKDLALRSPFTSLCQQRQSPRFYYRLFLCPRPKVSFCFPMQLLKKSQLISFFLLNTFVLCGFWEKFIFTHFLCYLCYLRLNGQFSLFFWWHANGTQTSEGSLPTQKIMGLYGKILRKLISFSGRDFTYFYTLMLSVSKLLLRLKAH